MKNTANTRQVNTGAMIALPKNFASHERRNPFTRARGRADSTARASDTGRPSVIATGTTNSSSAIRVVNAQRISTLQVPRNPNDTHAYEPSPSTRYISVSRSGQRCPRRRSTQTPPR